MSLKTWLEEFYPVPVNLKEFTPERDDGYCFESDLERLEHAELKFTGTYIDSLKRHEVFFCEGDIIDIHVEEIFSFDGGSCALCVKYDPGFSGDCSNCPLRELTSKCSYKRGFPWGKFIDDGDPSDMLKVIREAMESEEIE